MAFNRDIRPVLSQTFVVLTNIAKKYAFMVSFEWGLPVIRCAVFGFGRSLIIEVRLGHLVIHHWGVVIAENADHFPNYLDGSEIHGIPFRVTLTFVETSHFTRQLSECVEDEDYRAFQQELLADPEGGDLLARHHRRTNQIQLCPRQTKSLTSPSLIFLLACGKGRSMPPGKSRPERTNSRRARWPCPGWISLGSAVA